MTDSVLPNRVAPPTWLLTMVGGVIVVGAITFFANLLDNSTYFGFSHNAAIQTLTALVAVPAAIATGVSLWLYVPSVRGGSFGRVVFSLYAGCMGGGAVAAIFLILRRRSITKSCFLHRRHILLPTSKPPLPTPILRMAKTTVGLSHCRQCHRHCASRKPAIKPFLLSGGTLIPYSIPMNFGSQEASVRD